MKFYISTTGIKRIAVSSAAGGAGGGIWQDMKTKNSTAAAVGRRLTRRTAMLPVVLLLGLVLPFLFVRTAFLVLESAALCSSSFGNFFFFIFNFDSLG